MAKEEGYWNLIESPDAPCLTRSKTLPTTILSPCRPKKKHQTAKFTQNTKAYKMLKGMFEEGKITPTDKPSDVRSTDPEYQQYTPTQFRSQFNKLKSLIGINTRDGKGL